MTHGSSGYVNLVDELISAVQEVNRSQISKEIEERIKSRVKSCVEEILKEYELVPKAVGRS